MLDISIISGVIFLILAFIAGMFVNYFLSKSKNSDYKGQWEKLNAEHEKSSKDLARSRKSHDRLENERDSWKQKFEDLQNDLTNTKSENRSDNKILRAEIDQLKKDIETAQAEKNRSSTKMERMKGELESLKRKIGIERDGYKGTKVDLEETKRANVKLQAEIEKIKNKNKGLQESAEKNFQKMADINEINSTNRRLRAKNIKLETDIEYWEKKHYDTHHELAALKVKYQTLKQGSQGANSLN